MNFSDIFKSSFLLEYTTEMSTAATVVYLAVAAAIGLYIFLIYRLMTKKSFYNKSFNISLWVLVVVTAAIIITISSNIILSLGMVGALSIVRYRTAIKDPMDLVFLFWAIAEGIMCGAGMAEVGVVLAVVITVGIFILNILPMPRPLRIMTISASDPQCEDAVMQVVEKYFRRCSVKAKTVSADQLELVVEFGGDKERECVRSLMEIDGVQTVSLLTHDGEVTF